MLLLNTEFRLEMRLFLISSSNCTWLSLVGTNNKFSSLVNQCGLQNHPTPSTAHQGRKTSLNNVHWYHIIFLFVELLCGTEGLAGLNKVKPRFTGPLVEGIRPGKLRSTLNGDTIYIDLNIQLAFGVEN